MSASAQRLAKPAMKPVMKPERRGRPRSQALRFAVLAATHALLYERGFKGTTVEAIAERAGASKVTLYRWWPNKAAIVMDAFLAKTSPELPFQHTDSALEDLRAQMLAFCHVLSGRAGRLLAVLAAEGVLEGEVGRAFRERWVAPRRAEVRVILQQGIDRGELPAALDFEVICDAFFGPLYYRLLTQHQPLTKAFADKLWTLVVHGIHRRGDVPVPPRRAEPAEPSPTARRSHD